MNKPLYASAGSVLLMLATSSAYALDAKWYVGGSPGQSNIDETVGNVNIDDDDTGWKVFGGYDFTNALGLEVGWVELGDFQQSGTDLSMNGATVTALGRMPLSKNWNAFVKGGAFTWDAESNVATAEGDGTDLVGGAGVRFQVPNNENFGVRGEWEYFDSEPQTNLYSLGLELRFQ